MAPETAALRSVAVLDRTPAIVKLGFAAITALLLDSLVRNPGALDYGLIDALRSVHFPSDERWFERARALTRLEVTIVVWLLLLAATLVLKHWAHAIALVAVPIAGGLGWALGTLSHSPPIDPGRLSEPASSESAAVGAVAAAVALWGVLFWFATKIPSKPLRWGAGLLCAAAALVAGPSRVWSGSMWVTDMALAYLAAVVVLVWFLDRSRRAEPYLKNAPLISARRLPHGKATPHTHALTSLIHFRGERVWKVYSPGFLPQAVYWLAFQAPFPYAHNTAALSAAVHRRNLVGALTEYWYGDRRVARALRIDEVDGRPAVVGEFVEGEEPLREAARPFLEDLAANFERAGIPTWQIDPRQPRSAGNLIETPDGRMVVIDLESGLVSPLASFGAWKRALRRRVVPIFDDVYFDITRAYIGAESEAMREKMGAEWFESVEHELDLAEQDTIAWHASEPRIWARMLGWLFTGFHVRSWRRRARQRIEDGREGATEWLESAIEQWEDEGRLTASEANEMRAQVESDTFQAVLPHFGVHLAISVVLRFPFGSIARFAYTSGNFLLAGGLLIVR
jgi:hypothetical protein